MKKPASAAALDGLLPRNDERPPWFAFTVSLYKSDLLFRSLVDLSAAGLLILLFSGALSSALQPVTSAARSLFAFVNKPTSVIRTDGSTNFTAHDQRPGLETILGITPPAIPDIVVQRAAADSAAVLGEVRRLLKRDEFRLMHNLNF